MQIAGVLILAAGMPRVFDEQDFGVVTLGYVVMRVGAGRRSGCGPRRGRPAAPARPAVRYAAGVSVVQVGWVRSCSVPGRSRAGSGSS